MTAMAIGAKSATFSAFFMLSSPSFIWTTVSSRARRKRALAASPWITTNRHGVRPPWSGTWVADWKMVSSSSSSGAGAVSSRTERRVVRRSSASIGVSFQVGGCRKTVFGCAETAFSDSLRVKTGAIIVKRGGGRPFSLGGFCCGEAGAGTGCGLRAAARLPPCGIRTGRLKTLNAVLAAPKPRFQKRHPRVDGDGFFMFFRRPQTACVAEPHTLHKRRPSENPPATRFWLRRSCTFRRPLPCLPCGRLFPLRATPA